MANYCPAAHPQYLSTTPIIRIGQSTMNRAVLILSTYPHTIPRHGGQLRVANISKAYANDGWSVHSIAVYEPDAFHGAAVGKHDVAFPNDSAFRFFNDRHVPFISDLLSGAFASSDSGGFPSICAKLPIRIDAIHVEQPWLWPLAKRIKELDQHRSAVLIYGSQNIERNLKSEIFLNYGINNAEDAIEAVGQLERIAATEADISLAVTQSDLSELAKLGARKLLLAPNGIAPWSASSAALAKWKKRLPTAPWALYIASAHPPNFTNFCDSVGGSLGCIPPDTKLVVAGGVCEPLYRAVEASAWNSLNLSRLELLFELSDEDLAAVKTLAHTFLLPIQHGGGSNIKTAEALFSGAYVIGTEAAFRGFERFKELPGVTACTNAQEVQRALRTVLQTSSRPVSLPASDELRQQLRWDECLAAVPREVSQLTEILGKK